MTRFLAALALLLALPEAPSSWEGIDATGLEAFWPVMDSLLADEEPSSEAWDLLWATPGYAALEEREGRREGFSQAFRAAFRPSAGQLRADLEQQRYWARVLAHLDRIPAQRSELSRYAAGLSAGELLDLAVTDAASLLPEGAVPTGARPPVAMVVFASDGRGYSNLLVIDVLNLMDKPDPRGFLAHESHHFFRSGIAVGEWPEDVPENLLLHALAKLEVEGIPDQFDKGELPSLSDEEFEARYESVGLGDYYGRYRAAYAEAPQTIEWLSDRLEEIATAPDRLGELGDAVFEEMPMEGRPLGAFMARTISVALGSGALAEVAGDTFAFLQRYQEAAHRVGAPAFSDGALAALDSLSPKKET
jgi:hypothetical protein